MTTTENLFGVNLTIDQVEYLYGLLRDQAEENDDFFGNGPNAETPSEQQRAFASLTNSTFNAVLGTMTMIRDRGFAPSPDWPVYPNPWAAGEPVSAPSPVVTEPPYRIYVVSVAWWTSLNEQGPTEYLPVVATDPENAAFIAAYQWEHGPECEGAIGHRVFAAVLLEDFDADGLTTDGLLADARNDDAPIPWEPTPGRDTIASWES